MKKRNFTLTFFVALSFVAILAIIGFIIYRETGLEVTHEENDEYVVVEGDRLNFYDIQPYVFEPWENQEEALLEGEPASPELSEYVNRQGKDIVNFINHRFKKNWQYNYIDVYITDAEEAFGGFYLPTYKRLYINKKFVFANVNDAMNLSIKYQIFHELIHAATDENRGTPFFYNWYSEDAVLGIYMHEGITEYLTEEYAQSIGMSLKDVYKDGVSSGYVNLVYYLRATDAVFEGTINDILDDNMSDIEARMNEKTRDDEAFDKWLFAFDFTQINYLNYGEDKNNFINPFVFVESMTCFLSSVTDNQEALLKEINVYYDKAFGYNEGNIFFESVDEAIDDMHYISIQ